MLHLGSNVFLEQMRQLIRSEMAIGQPFGVVVVPDETVTADFHSMGDSEADNFVGLSKVKPVRVCPNDPLLHRIFWFNHVELM